MININWGNFKAKFNERERAAFERLAYILFCYEHNKPIGVFRFKNQTGIETEPILIDGSKIGFQAKYYDTKLADNKSDIIDSLQKAKSKNPDLNVVLIYTNQEFSESTDKNKKKPKYVTEIENAAQKLNLLIGWRLPSHIEIQLLKRENEHYAQHFFSLDNGIIEFIRNIKSHTEYILASIHSDIQFKGQSVKIDRAEILNKLLNSLSQVQILSGDGGTGKTALLKDLFVGSNHPFYLFKAAEFHKSTLSEIFSQFGHYGIADFFAAHKEETNKTVVIDSAEKLSDTENQDVFIEFLSALIENNWKVIFTTRNSYLDDLRFQMFEVYRQSFNSVKLENLAANELSELSEKFQFAIPGDERLQTLICNPFYLNEYLFNYDTLGDQPNSITFRETLWQKKIQNSRNKRDNIHREREKCFLAIARKRCDSGNFFVQKEKFDRQALSYLEADEIIKFEPSANGYFITHDIYEEWALEKLIETEFISANSYPLFFQNIGNSLPIRRAFRSWLSDKLIQTDSGIKQFIQGVFTEKEVPEFWKDELLVSVLLSDYANSFFEIFEKSLLENRKFYLKKIIFLLRTACKEVDSETQRIFETKKDLSISPSYLFTKPKGKGWEVTIEYLLNKITSIQKEEIPLILPLLKEWIDKHPVGVAARKAGLFALHFYKDSELNDNIYYGDETEQLLLRIVLSAARELKEELIEITNILLATNYNRREAFDSFREKVLTSNHESLAFIVTLPDYVIKLAEKSWLQPNGERHLYEFGGIDIEQHYSLRSQWHHDYFPASALQTPIYYLLLVSFPKTINFILEFTNKTVGAYYASGFDESVQEIKVTIGEDKSRQYISSGLWNMYRGEGSPVTPYLLQSIHMALEKHLLAMSKSYDKEIAESWLIYLLKNTRSASITAVVTSVVLANYEKFFDVALILFSNYEFFRFDNLRASSEEHAKSLYSIGRGMNWQHKEFEDERIATCDNPHRKLSLENLALQYQFFKTNDITDEEAEVRKSKIWDIIDSHYKAIPKEAIASEENKIKRLLLTRMDRRKMNPKLTQHEDKVLIEFNPSLPSDLKEFSEEGLKDFNSTFKHTALKLWAMNKFDGRRKYGTYPQYEDNPELILKETREIIENLNDENAKHILHFDSQIPAYSCAALIKLYQDKLSDDDLLFCSEVITEYATAPLRENYNYQIADGVEVAISTVPYLYKLYPGKKNDLNNLLLLVLFDEYPIGEYKRVCDYVIEAINNSLYDLSPGDANAILFGYLMLKPVFDLEYNPRKQMREGKSRLQIVQEFTEKYANKFEGINSSKEYFDKIDFSALSIRTAETGFQIIPTATSDQLHLNFIKRLLDSFTHLILQDTRYTDNESEADFRLKHRFLQRYVSFLLHREVVSIKEWTLPFVDGFTPSEGMARFLSDMISEEIKLSKYDSFWAVWECFFEPIKAVVLKSRHRDLNEIIRNYMLAWQWWTETAKEWVSFRERDALFIKKICDEMGSHPTVLFSISKLLNEVGSPFLNHGIFWIADMLSLNKNLQEEELYPSTIYYIEIITRKYTYLNRSKIKMNQLMKEKILTILNFLVSKGSVNGYLLREDIL